MIALWIILAIVLIAIVLYNSLIRARTRVDEAWSDIEVQLKRRYDLIPNLVETVKGYARQEASVLENVTKARTQAMQAGSLEEKLKDENQLTGALGRLFAVAEAYPDLKSNTNFLQMQGDLRDTEDKIQAARRFYNGTVRDYNIKLSVFPTSVFAGMMGFKAKPFFDIPDEGPESQNVKVSF